MDTYSSIHNNVFLNSLERSILTVVRIIGFDSTKFDKKLL